MTDATTLRVEELIAAIDEELRALVERCLSPTPDQRPSAATIRDALGR
jgi:hypothetical protein